MNKELLIKRIIRFPFGLATFIILFIFLNLICLMNYILDKEETFKELYNIVIESSKDMWGTFI